MLCDQGTVLPHPYKVSSPPYTVPSPPYAVSPSSMDDDHPSKKSACPSTDGAVPSITGAFLFNGRARTRDPKLGKQGHAPPQRPAVGLFLEASPPLERMCPSSRANPVRPSLNGALKGRMKPAQTALSPPQTGPAPRPSPRARGVSNCLHQKTQSSLRQSERAIKSERERWRERARDRDREREIVGSE